MSLRPVHLRILNLVLCLFLVIFLAFLLSFVYELELPSQFVGVRRDEKIQNSFDQKSDLDTVLSSSFYTLEKNQITFDLPDLRNMLFYYSMNRRPDALNDKQMLFVGMKGSQEVHSIRATDPVYLHQDPAVVNRWVFSKENAPTSLWAIFSPDGNRVSVTLFMHDEKKRVVQTPEHLHKFFLDEAQAAMPRIGLENWIIGDLRVDGSLLLRQKACWYGQDEFLNRFGQDEYDEFIDKERLEFFDGNARYYCYVTVGTCLVFEDGRWGVVDPSEDTRRESLLVVRNVDDRLMSFDLWSSDGKHRFGYDLPKSQKAEFDPARFNMRLVGARSKKEWIVTIGGQRTTVHADDWILFSGDTWEKIISPEQLDAYVQGDLNGYLLVLEGTEKLSQETCLVGMLYDETRCRGTACAIQPFHIWSKDSHRDASKSAKQDDDDDEDDDDLYDDDDDEDYDDDDDYDDEDDDLV